MPPSHFSACQCVITVLHKRTEENQAVHGMRTGAAHISLEVICAVQIPSTSNELDAWEKTGAPTQVPVPHVISVLVTVSVCFGLWSFCVHANMLVQMARPVHNRAKRTCFGRSVPVQVSSRLP